MIKPTEEMALWLHIAKNNSIIQHQENKTGPCNRFARFNDEGTIGELTKLDHVIRLELRDNPIGSINANDSNSFMYDTMYRVVRVIGKVTSNDFTAKVAMQERAKAALFEAVRFLTDAAQDGESCNSKLIRMFDPTKVTYELLETATADGSFCGAQMRLQFKAAISNEPVDYPTFQFPLP